MKKDKFIKEIGWVLKEKYGFKHSAEFESDIQRLKKGSRWLTSSVLLIFWAAR